MSNQQTRQGTGSAAVQSSPPQAPGSRFRPVEDSYALALVLILATIGCLATVSEDAAAKLVSVALGGITLLFVLRASNASARIQRISLLVVVVAVVSAAIALIFGRGKGADIGAGLLSMLLAFVAPVVILRHIVRSLRVSFQLLLGALCVYLLFGLVYTYLFAIIGTTHDGLFFVQVINPVLPDYLYFSYTTLTTTGYGDLTAAGSLDRMIGISEALIGQLFLVSAVAVLAGNIGHELNRATGRGGRSAEDSTLGAATPPDDVAPDGPRP